MSDVPHRRVSLPGGWFVLLAGTSSGNAPGHTGGMTTNASETWVRLVRFENVAAAWDSGWHRAGERSLLKLTRWWEAVERAEDIPDAWDITVGGAWPPPRYDETYFKGVAWLEGA